MKAAEAPLPVPDAVRPFAGQLALVTGAARRVGRAIAEELAACGAQVAVHCHRSIEEAQAVAAALGAGSFVVQADLCRAAQVSAMFATARERSQSGRIDLLVNSAAGFRRTPFLQMTEAEWQEQLDLNLSAPQRCTRLAVSAGARSVVNLVDIAAWQPWSEFSAYSVSKAGLLHLTRILARELAPAVRVNAVAPGVALFPDDYDEEARARVLERVPLHRAGTPGDVARAVRFLLQEPFLTGVCLPVDGGQGLPYQPGGGVA